MRRVLLVSHEMTVTGAPNSLLRQAKYFRDAGCTVDVWTLKGGDLLPRYAEAGFAPALVGKDRQSILAQYGANPAPYDLVVCNTICTYRAVDVLRRFPLKVAWFVRETKLLDEWFWLNRDFAAVFSEFHNVYAVSDYAASVVRRYNPNVRTVRNSVADVFRGFAEPEDDVRFGFIGSVIPDKGVDLLVEAFRRAHAECPRISLTIAGGRPGDLSARLRAETADLPSVRWVGQVQGAEKQAFFDAIDVLCVPSLDEPSGLTVIEGTMQGKAVITTDRTGANYLVGEENGRIVRAGDVGSLAAALAELGRTDVAARRLLAEASRARYLRLGTSEVERTAVLRMFDECRPEPPAARPLADDSKTPWFHVERYLDGRRRLYFRNLRLLAFKGKAFRPK